MTDWLVGGAKQDAQSITASWQRAKTTLIDGVDVREISNVPKQDGWLTEVFRADWFGGEATIDQVFQVVLNPGAISAWHAHANTIDRLFVSFGMMRVVLYDNREGSPTRGVVNELRIGSLRPALIVVPARVWHGLQNIGTTAGIVLNLVDRAYEYEDPDHWRVAADSAEIPFKF